MDFSLEQITALEGIAISDLPLETVAKREYVDHVLLRVNTADPSFVQISPLPAKLLDAFRREEVKFLSSEVDYTGQFPNLFQYGILSSTKRQNGIGKDEYRISRGPRYPETVVVGTKIKTRCPLRLAFWVPRYDSI